MQQTLSTIDFEQLIRDADGLRDGQRCVSPSPPFKEKIPGLVAHGSHLNFPMTFEDGVRWMVRLKLRGPLWQEADAIVKAQQMSEAATFQALHDAGLPVPQVYVPDSSMQSTHSLLIVLISYADYRPRKASLFRCIH